MRSAVQLDHASGTFSDLQSLLITSILYYPKDTENFGTGLKQISNACNEAECRFEFKILKSGFVVVFYRDESITAQDAIQDTVQDAIQDGSTVRQTILRLCEQPRSREEVMAACGLKNRAHFTSSYLRPMLQTGQIKMTIPDKPSSKNQKYIRA